jgi:amino acid transporter
VATESPSQSSDPVHRDGVLKPNAVGLVGVVFMVVAFSAPITAMTGNVPVAVGFGNGLGAPAGFVVACVILTIFSVGFVAMARHITAAGAFYTFVSRGINRAVGMGAGVMSMLAYMLIEAALIGLFSVFCQSTINSQFGIELPWIVYGVTGMVIIGVLSYRDISLATRVLGVVLVIEVLLLSIMAFAVLFRGGGPDGLMPGSLNPAAAFRTDGLTEGAAGLGLLFAFWSWVGFEATAIFGEESKNPKKIVPRATMIAVVGIGVFYSFISWMAVAGNGKAASIELSQSATPFELLYTPMREYVGAWGVTGFEWFVIGGSFACALAIHNSATRYLFAFGRDGLLPRALGRSHPVHQSPAVASTFQTLFTIVLVVGADLNGVDPYLELYVLLAVFATVALLSVQSLTSLACIWYFHVKKQHPETANVFRTLLAPVVGGLGMVYVNYLLLSNLSSAAGAAAETLFGRALPYLVLASFVVPVAVALYWRTSNPAKYAAIGSTIFTHAGLTTDIDEPTMSR